MRPALAFAIESLAGLHAHRNACVLGIGLQGVQEDFEERVLECRAIAAHDGRLIALVVLEQRGFHRLMRLRFAERFFHQRRERE